MCKIYIFKYQTIVSLGPSVGSFLYTAGGFGLPFYTVGSLGVILATFLLMLIPQIKEENMEKVETDNDESNDDRESETRMLMDDSQEARKPTMTLKLTVKVHIKCGNIENVNAYIA